MFPAFFIMSLVLVWYGFELVENEKRGVVKDDWREEEEKDKSTVFNDGAGGDFVTRM